MAEDILIPLGGMVLSGWIIYTVIAGIQNWYRRRTEAIFQSKILDKIGSVNELGTFLNSDAGVRFLKGLTSELASPEIRILRGVQSGVVLASLGLGLYIYDWFSPQVPAEVVNTINAIATILFALGAGFLVAAALSYRLSKQMGLLADDGDRRRETTTHTV
jgi:hypothetical protein